MKKTTISLLLLVLCATLALGGAACSSGGGKSHAQGDEDLEAEGTADEESADPYEITDKIQEGLDWLEEGQSYMALESFEAALEETPDNHIAIFGVAFASSQYGQELFTSLLSVFDGLGGMMGKSSDPESMNDWLAGEFYNVANHMSEQFERSLEEYEKIKDDENFSLSFEKLPIFVGVTQKAWISGEIDRADLVMFDSISRTFAMVFQVLRAHSFMGDLATVIFRVKAEYNDPDNATADMILRIAAYLLLTSDEFLGFTDTGEDEILDTGDLVLGALENIVSLESLVEAETDDQGDDITRVINDTYDGKKLAMRIYQENDDGEEEALDIVFVTEDIRPEIEKFKKNLEGDDEVPYVVFSDTVMPVLSSVVVVAFSFGLFDSLGLELPLPPGAIDPMTLNALLQAFVVGDTMAIDFHAYRDNPTDIRNFLPVIAEGGSVADWENLPYIEWECPEQLDATGFPPGSAGFFCNDDEAMEDMGHFVGTPYEIDADGTVLPTPYMAFADPTFGGMVYVDPAALDLSGYPASPQWQPADQKSFNRCLGRLLSKITGLLGR